MCAAMFEATRDHVYTKRESMLGDNGLTPEKLESSVVIKYEVVTSAGKKLESKWSMIYNGEDQWSCY